MSKITPQWTDPNLIPPGKNHPTVIATKIVRGFFQRLQWWDYAPEDEEDYHQEALMWVCQYYHVGYPYAYRVGKYRLYMYHFHKLKGVPFELPLEPFLNDEVMTIEPFAEEVADPFSEWLHDPRFWQTMLDLLYQCRQRKTQRTYEALTRKLYVLWFILNQYQPTQDTHVIPLKIGQYYRTRAVLKKDLKKILRENLLNQLKPSIPQLDLPAFPDEALPDEIAHTMMTLNQKPFDYYPIVRLEAITPMKSRVWESLSAETQQMYTLALAGYSLTAISTKLYGDSTVEQCQAIRKTLMSLADRGFHTKPRYELELGYLSVKAVRFPLTAEEAHLYQLIQQEKSYSEIAQILWGKADYRQLTPLFQQLYDKKLLPPKALLHEWGTLTGQQQQLYILKRHDYNLTHILTLTGLTKAQIKNAIEILRLKQLL